MTLSPGKFYIGIDSGGTKCELMIVSEYNKILFRKKYRGVHYSVSGAKVYSKEVSGFISDALKHTAGKIPDCIKICIGTAGAREVHDREALRNEFRKRLKTSKVIVTTDAMTALYGAFEGGEGIIMISGTGSVLYGYTGGKITRIGGWGRIIGDEGSGYWIGKRALNLIAKEFDLGREDVELALILKKKFGITRVNLNSVTFRKDFEIQKIAPFVIECAERNCALSMQIVKEAVEGLIFHVKRFIVAAKIKHDMNIAFIGSIIENDNILSRLFRKELRKLKIIKVKKKKHDSSYGAVLLAMEDSQIIKKL